MALCRKKFWLYNNKSFSLFGEAFLYLHIFFQKQINKSFDYTNIFL